MRKNIKGCKHCYFMTTQVFQHKEKNKTTGTYTGLTHSDIDVCRSPFGNAHTRDHQLQENVHTSLSGLNVLNAICEVSRLSKLLKDTVGQGKLRK